MKGKGESLMIREIDIWEYAKSRSEDDLVVDLREPHMYQYGTLPGAVNIPIGQIQRLYELPKDRDIYLFCQAGEFSEEIAELLSDNGFRTCNLTGGYRKYLRCSLEESGSGT